MLALIKSSTLYCILLVSLMLFYEYFSPSPLELFGCFGRLHYSWVHANWIVLDTKQGAKPSEKQVELVLSERIGWAAETGSSFGHSSQLRNSLGEHSFWLCTHIDMNNAFQSTRRLLLLLASGYFIFEAISVAGNGAKRRGFNWTATIQMLTSPFGSY